MIFSDDTGEMFPKTDSEQMDSKAVNGRSVVPRSSSTEPKDRKHTTNASVSSGGKKASHSRSKSDVGVASPRKTDDQVHARMTPSARDYTGINVLCFS